MKGALRVFILVKMICFLLFCCLAGCLGLDVRQSVSDLIMKPGDEEQISCSHDRTDYRVMLWYQQSPGDTAMKLIGYLHYKAPTMEESYKDHFIISGDLGGTTLFIVCDCLSLLK
uniref:Immunoglobulin V-set domain-containing protein n=1 Tax=Gasterosteus aculeatus aculeatus TaxID=481459 RepID=A0AAQ4RPS7_GASAC